MKTSLPRPLFAWVLLLAAGLFAVPTLVSAQEPETQEDEHHSELETAMEALKKGMRALRRGIENPEKTAEMIVIAQAMQEAALAGYWHCPDPLEDLDAAGKAAWEVGFKKGQLAVCGLLCEMELALAKGELEEAKAIYGKLNDLKGKGHDKYDPE